LKRFSIALRLLLDPLAAGSDSLGAHASLVDLQAGENQLLILDPGGARSRPS